jgi:hypothetical protein
MTQKLGTYDVIAGLIPGLALLWGLAWLCDYFGAPRVIPISSSLGDTSLLLALAYVTGLLLQGISQGITEKLVLALSGGFPSSRWLFEDDGHFSVEYKTRLKEAIASTFDTRAEPVVPKELRKNQAREVKSRRYQELFYLCYNLVDQKKLSDRPLIFNAQYGLFRAMLTLALLVCAVFTAALALRWPQIAQKGDLPLWFWILAFFGASAIVAFSRMRKRGEDFAKSIYDLFYSYYCDQHRHR